MALSASSPLLGLKLESMARAIGLAPIVIPEKGRARYHAGAVLCAGGLVALRAATERLPTATAYAAAALPLISLHAA